MKKQLNINSIKLYCIDVFDGNFEVNTICRNINSINIIEYDVIDASISYFH